MKKDGVMLRHGRGRFVDGASEDQTYEGEWCDVMMQGRGLAGRKRSVVIPVSPSWTIRRARSASLTV
jgi:hypothetical protein